MTLTPKEKQILKEAIEGVCNCPINLKPAKPGIEGWREEIYRRFYGHACIVPQHDAEWFINFIQSLLIETVEAVKIEERKPFGVVVKDSKNMTEMEKRAFKYTESLNFVYNQAISDLEAKKKEIIKKIGGVK